MPRSSCRVIMHVQDYVTQRLGSFIPVSLTGQENACLRRCTLTWWKQPKTKPDGFVGVTMSVFNSDLPNRCHSPVLGASWSFSLFVLRPSHARGSERSERRGPLLRMGNPVPLPVLVEADHFPTTPKGVFVAELFPSLVAGPHAGTKSTQTQKRLHRYFLYVLLLHFLTYVLPHLK